MNTRMLIFTTEFCNSPPAPRISVLTLFLFICQTKFLFFKVLILSYGRSWSINVATVQFAKNLIKAIYLGCGWYVLARVCWRSVSRFFCPQWHPDLFSSIMWPSMILSSPLMCESILGKSYWKGKRTLYGYFFYK